VKKGSDFRGLLVQFAQFHADLSPLNFGNTQLLADFFLKRYSKKNKKLKKYEALDSSKASCWIRVEKNSYLS